MIKLNWQQVSDNRQEARHGARLFVVDRVPNWDRHPAMTYEYRASTYCGAEFKKLGTHTDSKAAREKCVEFINTQAGD